MDCNNSFRGENIFFNKEYCKMKITKNKYIISHGNLLVLKSIPEMLLYPKFRKELRRLTIEFNFLQTLGEDAIRKLKNENNKR